MASNFASTAFYGVWVSCIPYAARRVYMPSTEAISAGVVITVYPAARIDAAIVISFTAYYRNRNDPAVLRREGLRVVKASHGDESSGIAGEVSQV